MKKSLSIMAIPGILIATICIFSSCTKSKDEKRVVYSDYIKFSSAGLQYVKLPLNTYYIYKDSATGSLDSVVVTKSSIEKKFNPAFTTSLTMFSNTTYYEFPDYYSEEFVLELTKFTSNSQQAWLLIKASNNNPFTLYSPPDSSIMVTNNINGSDYTIFMYPYFPGSGQEILPSFTLEGKTYTDVVKYGYDYGTNNNKIKWYYYYWAKGVGLIKRTEVTPTSRITWTLLRNG